MKHIAAAVAVALVGCGTSAQMQPAPQAPVVPAAPQEPVTSVTAPSTDQAPPVAEAPPADNGLNDLATMTFGCPKAALNAAAREAAKVQSQGTYQFAYFGIVSDSHHAAYEVHFKSNYREEPLLRYCVSIYCQQGWDPKNTQAAVTLMPDASPAAGAQAKAGCGAKHMHAGARRIEGD